MNDEWTGVCLRQTEHMFLFLYFYKKLLFPFPFVFVMLLGVFALFFVFIYHAVPVLDVSVDFCYLRPSKMFCCNRDGRPFGGLQVCDLVKQHLGYFNQCLFMIFIIQILKFTSHLLNSSSSFND